MLVLVIAFEGGQFGVIARGLTIITVSTRAINPKSVQFHMRLLANHISLVQGSILLTTSTREFIIFVWNECRMFIYRRLRHTQH